MTLAPRLPRSPRALLAAVVLGCAAALAGALVTQHVYDMQPCPWCILQRLIFSAIAVAALVGIAWPARGAQRLTLLLTVMLALAGMATALWQHFVAASSTSCNMTLADRIVSATGLDMALPAVFAAYASCADSKVQLFGVPYEFWSLALFAGMLAAAAVAWRRLSV